MLFKLMTQQPNGSNPSISGEINCLNQGCRSIFLLSILMYLIILHAMCMQLFFLSCVPNIHTFFKSWKLRYCLSLAPKRFQVLAAPVVCRNQLMPAHQNPLSNFQESMNWSWDNWWFEIVRGRSIHTMEISSHNKSGLDLLFYWLSELKKMIEKMLIVQLKL